MAYHVITHNGKAHMDELLAISLLAIHLGEEPSTITQKQSQAVSDMLLTKSIPEDTYFIDAGLEYDPQRKLFDHHQDANLDSSALQIFNHFFPHLENTDLHEYISLVSRVDATGLKSLDDAKIVNESKIYWSFSQSMLLRLFERDPWPVLRIVIAGLKDKIDFEQKTIQGARWLSESGNTEIVRIKDVNVLKYNRQPPQDLISATRNADAVIIERNNITATYSFDDRDPNSRILFRTNIGSERIDFTKANPAKSLFAHKGGFLLRFIPESDTEWERLIIESLSISFED